MRFFLLLFVRACRCALLGSHTSPTRSTYNEATLTELVSICESFTRHKVASPHPYVAERGSLSLATGPLHCRTNSLAIFAFYCYIACFEAGLGRVPFVSSSLPSQQPVAKSCRCLAL